MPTETDLTELEQRAIALADDGSRWHFHIATEGCRLAEGRRGLTFLLEDQTAGEVYRAAGTDSDRSVGSRLVARLHGNEVLESEPIEPQTDEFSREMQELLDVARGLSGESKPWHHHVLFPGCAFNPSSDTWTVQIEGPDMMCSATSEGEPKAALSVIEKLFYAQQSIG